MLMRLIRPAVSLLIVMTVVLGLLYPLVVTLVAKAAFRTKRTAASSYAGRQARRIDAHRPELRRIPSTSGADPPRPRRNPTTTGSSASNLGPLNPALLKQVEDNVKTLRAADPDNRQPVPVDLVTASASGLDPHITPAAAYYQAARVARARNLPLGQVDALIAAHEETALLGVLGERRVNVLELNLALDRLQPTAPPAAGSSRRGRVRLTKPALRDHMRRRAHASDGICGSAMAETERRDPDQLLADVQRQEARARRGRLRIFFGASAGVGKTYSMLEAAHGALAGGADIVVGYVEPHGRAETEGLARRPPAAAILAVGYRGIVRREFDLDAALKRAPAIVLVDELAHSNLTDGEPVPRHAKRWQDVEELLDAGISVWTTLNVQHLESLNDVVAGITGVRQGETLPDRIFDEADEVELIDLPPDDLLERLKAGKVYAAAQVSKATEGFFRIPNLLALRELALRRTADRVDAAALEFAGQAPTSRPWLARDRFLIAVTPDGQAEELVRIGKRFADALDAEWLVVSVETPQLLKLSGTRAQSPHQRAAARRIAGRRNRHHRRRVGSRCAARVRPSAQRHPHRHRRGEAHGLARVAAALDHHRARAPRPRLRHLRDFAPRYPRAECDG